MLRTTKARLLLITNSGIVVPRWGRMQQCYSCDSPLRWQQLLQERIASNCPTTEVVALPDGCDPAIWQLENIREITKELNLLAVQLDQICNPTSCPVMNATDNWHYLCAAHKSPKEVRRSHCECC